MKIDVAKNLTDYEGRPVESGRVLPSGPEIVTLRRAMISALDACITPETTLDEKNRYVDLAREIGTSDIVDLDGHSWRTVMTAAQKNSGGVAYLAIRDEIDAVLDDGG